MKVRKLHTKKKQIDNERYKFKIVNSRQFEFQYFTEKDRKMTEICPNPDRNNR